MTALCRLSPTLADGWMGRGEMPTKNTISPQIRNVRNRLLHAFDNMGEDLKFAGEAAAEAIVVTTLAGIGEGDAPFAPYSRAYQEVLDAVGGKMRGTVDLRGIFYHAGQKRVRYRSEARRRQYREGRQAYIRVAFGNLSFTARTGVTRPAKGIIDPLSEMSRDLISVVATDYNLKITYTARSEPYMIAHQEGSGRAPKRVWFTLNKTKVREALLSSIRTAIAARVNWFNRPQMEAAKHA